MFNSKKLVLSVGMAALVSQSMALPSAPRRVATIKPHAGFLRRDDNSTDICNDFDLSDDVDTRGATWRDTGAGDWLDQFISDHGEADWVVNVDRETLADGPSVYDCGSIEGTCPAPAGCSKFDKIDAASAFWVMLAVNKAYSAFMYLHESWQDSGIETALDLDSLIADFGEADADYNMFGIMSGAMVVASAAVGFIPGVGSAISAAFTVGIGSFSLAATTTPDAVDPSAAVSDQASQAWEATKSAIEDTMKVAFTGGQDGYPSTSLPNLPGVYDNPVADFFSDGRWLVPSVDDYMGPVVDELTNRMKHGIINVLVKNGANFLFIDEDTTDEESCGEWEGASIWLTEMPNMENGEGCGILFHFQDSRLTYGYPAESDLTDKLIDYGIDLTEMYANAWICASNHPDGDGTLDVHNMPYSQDLPECFYNMGVIRGTYDGDYEIYVDDINTTGNGW